MKLRSIVLCFLAAYGSAHAATMAWQPSAGRTQIPIWPGAAPDAQPVPGPENVTLSKELPAGKPMMGVTNVTRPTITVYAPEGKNSGAAVLVIPGGGFQMLAIDLEGTEICDWLTSKGITCVLLKYRVPSAPYVWKCDCRPHNLSISVPSLQRRPEGDAAGALSCRAVGTSIRTSWRAGVLGRRIPWWRKSAQISSADCIHPWTAPTRRAAVRILPCPSILGISSPLMAS